MHIRNCKLFARLKVKSNYGPGTFNEATSRMIEKRELMMENWPGKKYVYAKIIRILHKSNKALVQHCLANIRFLQTISDVIDRLRLARKLLNILRRHTQVEAGAGQSNDYLSK